MLDGMLLTQHLAAHSLELTHAKLKYYNHCMVTTQLFLSIPPPPESTILFCVHKYDCF